MNISYLGSDSASVQSLQKMLAQYGYEVHKLSYPESGEQNLPLYDSSVLVIETDPKSVIGTVMGLRAKKVNTPILILSDCGDWQSKVAVLEVGADDYVTRPYHVEELAVRLRALARRGVWGKKPDLLRVAGLTIDRRSTQACIDELPLTLTSFEYRFLVLLAERPGQVQSRKLLAQALYRDRNAPNNSLAVIAFRLRKKLRESSMTITTHWGQGYSLDTV